MLLGVFSEDEDYLMKLPWFVSQGHSFFLRRPPCEVVGASVRALQTVSKLLVSILILFLPRHLLLKAQPKHGGALSGQ